ncbi:thermonuclease family protein [Candidatus Zixiibacteriota bacterium]
MIFRQRVGCILLIFVLIVSCTDSTSDRRSQTVRVLKVIDGDTIVLTDGRDVRYMCLDTPERDEPYYEDARRLNHDLVDGKTITLRFGARATDRYGRTLAMVYVGELSVAESLITAGLAVVYGFSDNQKFLPPLIIRQREAIKKKIGIWSILPEGDEEQYVASTVGFRFHRPECESAGQIREDHRIQYDSRRAAFYQGLSPCGRCQP